MRPFKRAWNNVAYALSHQHQVIVSGMHRSGTSFAMSVLADAGLEIGSNLVGATPGNPAGHFEDKKVVRINQRILAESGGNWQDPPARIVASPGAKRSIRSRLARSRKSSTFGMKDPRFCLTYDVWAPYLKSPALLLCFRHPLAVAQSLQNRNQIPIDEGLGLWNTYNLRALEIATRARAVFWINFDSLRDSTWAFHRCCEDAGLHCSHEEIDQRYQPNLHHHQPDLASVPASFRETYERLVEAWNANRDLCRAT